MKFSFHRLPLIALAAALVLRGSSLPILAEDLTLGVAPAPLEWEAKTVAPPALAGSYGDPATRAPSAVTETVWNSSGTLLLSGMPSGLHENQLSLWAPVARQNTLALQGYLGMTKPWTLSPDGSLIFGVATQPPYKKGLAGCYRVEDRKGLWALRAGVLDNVVSAVFSKDSKTLAVLHAFKEKCAVTLLDAVSGRKLKEFPTEVNAGYAYRVAGAMAFVHDGLLLNPNLDPQRNLILLDLDSWTPKRFATPSDLGWSGARFTTSKDDRWVVVWDQNTYVVFDHSGGNFREMMRGHEDTFDMGTGGFTSVTLSPDGRTLVTSGNGRHKVIELATQKVVHDSERYCMCGVFHPDGKSFWRTCTPFVKVSTGEWSAGEPEKRGHFAPVRSVAESPDGKWVATQDAENILVWPSGSQTPAFSLRPVKDDEPWHFWNVMWSADSKSLYAGDSWSVLRWNIPASPASPGQVLKVTGMVAFEDKPRRAGDRIAAFQQLIGSHQGEWCVLHGAKGGAVMRNLTRPDLIETISARQGLVNMASNYWFTKDDRSLLVYGNPGLALYDFAARTSREVPLENRSSMLGWVDARGWAILTTQDRSLVFFDINEQKSKLRFPCPTYNANFFGARVATSADGRWVALTLRGQREHDGFLIYDLDKQELACFQPLASGQGEGSVLAFTHDGRTLLTGLEGGSVLRWDMAKLMEPPLPQGWPKSALDPNLPKGGATRPPRVASWDQTPFFESTLPTRPLRMDESSAWTIQADGAASAGEDFPSIGHITIGGQALIPFSTESNTAPDAKAFTATLMLQTPDHKVQVRREMKGFSGWGGQIIWVDSVVNTTEQTLETDLTFEANPGLDTAALCNEENEPVRMEGNVIVPSPNMPLVGGEQIKEGGRSRARYFQFIVGPRPAVTPVLKWDAARHTLIAVHHLKLPPLGMRILMHAGNTSLLPLERACRDFFQASLHRLNGDTALVERYFTAQNLAMASNYSEDLEWKKKFPRPPRRDTITSAAPTKDSFGFAWTQPLAPRGFSNELGVDRGLETWIDGASAFFYGLIPQVGKVGFVLGDTNAAKTLVLKRDANLRGQSASLVQATYATNTTNAPLHAKISLHTYLNQPAAVFCDAKGTELLRGKEIPAAQHGGKVLIALAGSNQPSQIFSLCGEQAKIKPSIRLVDDRILVMDYEVDFAPGQEITLLYGVAQRPGAAFGSPANTIASWQEKQDLQAAMRRSPGTKATPILPQAVNWNP